MSGWAKPQPLFNPVTAPADLPLTPAELLASPIGLLLFLPLTPLLRLAARRWPRAALLVGGLIWVVATAGPRTTAVLLAGLVLMSAWVLGLGRLRRRQRVSAGTMVALVWLGLCGLIAPLWWISQWDWYGWTGSRLPPLHHVGFAYFLLRFIAWGVDLARNPDDRLRPVETLCWLLYPPCMRLGPVLLRRDFLARFDAWDPRAGVPWRDVSRRLGLCTLGGFGLALVAANLPRIPAGAADFFASPGAYSTGALLRVLYLLPLQIYLMLWTYNELAAGLSRWVGIRVDDNFDWLPRAASVRSFWQRWHVTVGAWLREYIYIPLGGNRGLGGRPGLVPLNYAAVFGFCAAWHGPSWSFVAWGASQTLALIVQRAWDRAWKRAGRRPPAGRAWTLFCWLLTMNYQAATILMFADFEHLGLRVFAELARRVT